MLGLIITFQAKGFQLGNKKAYSWALINCLMQSDRFFAAFDWCSDADLNEFTKANIDSAQSVSVETNVLYNTSAVEDLAADVKIAVDQYKESNLNGTFYISADFITKSNDCKANQKLFGELIDAVKGYNDIGIVTNQKDWEKNMCNATDYKQYKLWYVSNDGNEDFHDFKKFGGWDVPTYKSVLDKLNECSLNIVPIYKAD